MRGYARRHEGRLRVDDQLAPVGTCVRRVASLAGGAPATSRRPWLVSCPASVPSMPV